MCEVTGLLQAMHKQLVPAERATFLFDSDDKDPTRKHELDPNEDAYGGQRGAHVGNRDNGGAVNK